VDVKGVVAVFVVVPALAVVEVARVVWPVAVVPEFADAVVAVVAPVDVALAPVVVSVAEPVAEVAVVADAVLCPAVVA
jgi:hypothetical protein